MNKSSRRTRGLIGLGLAIGMVVAACGGSSSTTNPLLGGNGGNGNPGNPGNGANGGQSLSSGLAANLDKLDSYQFTWSFSTSSATASSAESLTTSGTVVNKPAKAYKINNMGIIQVIAIGDKGWMSYDNGTSWLASTDYSASSSSLTSLLPVSMYGSNFDNNASQFSIKGNESKNGVDCVHYQGSSNLGAAGAVAGVSATFHSDLWVAKNGNYPVSGFYGWSASTGTDAGSWGYSFDITKINDSGNVVTEPTNVTTP